MALQIRSVVDGDAQGILVMLMRNDSSACHLRLLMLVWWIERGSYVCYCVASDETKVSTKVVRELYYLLRS